MKIVLTQTFKKKYKKLSREDQLKFKNKLDLLLSYGFEYPGLRIHKLNGKLSFIYSLSVNMSIRALFYKTNEENKLIIEFFDIGNHDIYNKKA